MRTLVPNEMLANPAVSILSAPNTSGPLSIGANTTMAGSLLINGMTTMVETVKPANPAAGQVKVYPKADHKLYILDSVGTETDLTFMGMTQAQGDARYDVLGAASTGDASHVAAADPHPVYLTQTEGDARYAPVAGGGYLTQTAADLRYLALTGGTLSGNLLFTADNTKDIGASGATRPRTVYAGTSVSAGTGTQLTVIGASGAGAYLVGSNFGGVLFGSATTTYFTMGPNNFQPFTDNSKDLGSSAQRFKDLYLARNLLVSTTGSINWIPTAVGSYGAGTWLAHNAYFDGTNFQAYTVANATAYLNLSAAGVSAAIAPAHANPVTGIQWLWGVSPSSATGATMFVGNANERIRNPVNATNNLSIESADGYVFSASRNGAFLTGNAYWDGTNWLRYDTSIAAAYLSVSNAGMVYATAAAGANPIAETSVFTVTSVGNLVMPGTANIGGLSCTNGGFIGGTLTLPQNTYIIWQDGNSGIMSYNRTFYFDEYANGWHWRDSSRALASAMDLSGGGSLTVGSSLVIPGAGGVYVNSTARPLMTFGGEQLNWDATAGGWRWVSQTNNAEWMRLNGGTFTVSVPTVVNSSVNIATNNYLYIGGAGMTNVSARGQMAWQANTGNGDFILGGGASRLYMHPNLSVYIGQDYPTFTVGGFVNITCNGVVTNSSKRYKSDIEVIPSALSLVMDPDISGVHFTYHQPDPPGVGFDVPATKKFGFLAESWQDKAPEVVTRGADGLVTAMDYQQVTAILFQAFKEYVTETDARIRQLEGKA